MTSSTKATLSTATVIIGIAIFFVSMWVFPILSAILLVGVFGSFFIFLTWAAYTSIYDEFLRYYKKKQK